MTHCANLQTPFPWHENLLPTIDQCIELSLSEDIGSGDISSNLINPQRSALATIVTRQAATVCGIHCAVKTFRRLDPACEITQHVNDGDEVASGQGLLTVRGFASSLLTAERTALNFLQCLSATATVTAQFVNVIRHTDCSILDTRKTLPGLRLLQKYAVYCGGGKNHRRGLDDAFLLKENHIAAFGSIMQLVKAARKLHPKRQLVIEVETFDELDQALAANVDRIMLDNFTVEMARRAVQQTKNRIPLEISGNIDLASCVAYAETGVNFISVGALTKNITAIDLSMRLSTHE